MATFAGSGFTGIAVAERETVLTVPGNTVIYTAPSTGFAIVTIAILISSATSYSGEVVIVDGVTSYEVADVPTTTSANTYPAVYVGPSQSIAIRYNSSGTATGVISVTGAEFT